MSEHGASMAGRGPRGRWILVLALQGGLLGLSSPAAAFENVCGGETHENACNSVNQRCICCSWSGMSGNCVWWAWEQGCREWGVALSTCSDAHYWDDFNASLVQSAPCPGTIFVCNQNTTQCGSADLGHVGWVLEVFPDGSINVSEQGCWWFDGVRERIIAAQNASPAMKYLYAPGTTSCDTCDCDPDATEERACSDGCGNETRTCAGDCTWGAWSGCDAPRECASGDIRECGVCGAEICLSDCTFSVCADPCARDGGGVLVPDSARLDSSGTANDPNLSGGCGCRAGRQAAASAFPGLVLACLALFGCARRPRAGLPRRPAAGRRAPAGPGARELARDERVLGGGAVRATSAARGGPHSRPTCTAAGPAARAR